MLTAKNDSGGAAHGAKEGGVDGTVNVPVNSLRR